MVGRRAVLGRYGGAVELSSRFRFGAGMVNFRIGAPEGAGGGAGGGRPCALHVPGLG